MCTKSSDIVLTVIYNHKILTQLCASKAPMHRRDANWYGVDHSQAAFWYLHILFCAIKSNKMAACYFVYSQSKHLCTKKVKASFDTNIACQYVHIVILSKSFLNPFVVFKCYFSGSFHRSAKVCSMINLNYRNILNQNMACCSQSLTLHLKNIAQYPVTTCYLDGSI